MATKDEGVGNSLGRDFDIAVVLVILSAILGIVSLVAIFKRNGKIAGWSFLGALVLFGLAVSVIL